MPARTDFNAMRIRRRLEAAINTGVLNALVETQTRMQKMVSKPGRGRLYAKTAAGIANFQRVMGGTAFAALRIGTAATPTAMRRMMTKARGGRYRNLGDAGIHRASAPGDPPTVRTGNLRRNIQMARPQPVRGPGKIGWMIGVNAVYARALEFGYRRLLPRPYVRPVLTQMRGVAPRMIRNALRLSGFRTA